MKFTTQADLKVANNVKFGLVDLRIVKKPSLKVFLKTLKRLDQPMLIEVEKGKYNLENICCHLVLILSENIDSQYPNKAAELQILKIINNELLKSTSYVSLLQGGAKELFKQFDKQKN